MKKMKEKIIQHMSIYKEWGEFFPAKFSPFAYNESMANLSSPKTREEILALGLKFQDNLQQTRGATTLTDIPDNINNVDDNIINEVLECSECERNYKIIPNELTFYRKWKIPIPRKCFFCRVSARFKLRTPSKLWRRQCMCEQEGHDHLDIRCPSGFETSYAHDRPEIIYCEKCYQQEVY